MIAGAARRDRMIVAPVGRDRQECWRIFFEEIVNVREAAFLCLAIEYRNLRPHVFA